MGPGKRRIELRIASSGTRAVLFTVDGQEDRIGSVFNGAFACEDVDATYRRLSGRGVVFVEPPSVRRGGSFAKFRDPDGNTSVLSSS